MAPQVLIAPRGPDKEEKSLTEQSVERSAVRRTAKEEQAYPPWKERAMRGLALWGDPLGQEIEHIGHGVYSVPSCSGEGSYEAYLAVFGGEESCNCPDRARPCKHLIAASITRAKARARSRREQAERTAARAFARQPRGPEGGAVIRAIAVGVAFALPSLVLVLSGL